MQVTDANGQLQPLDLSALQATVNRAAEGLEGIDVQAIIDETVKNLYNGVKRKRYCYHHDDDGNTYTY